MSRNLRTFSLFRRTLFTRPSSLTRQNGPVNVQHVRIVRPFVTQRRIQKATIWITVLTLLYYRLDTMVEDDEQEKIKKTTPVKEAVQQVRVAAELEKLGGDGGESTGTEEQAEHQMVEETDDEDDHDDLVPQEMPEDAWFIPLTWPRQCPQTFYKGDDPEWQAFVEFSKEQKRAHEVKEELAMLIGSQMAGHPQYQKFLGNPIYVGKHLLSIDFPDGPPPEYERFGIEITDDYIALTVRPIDDRNLFRLKRAIWPVATGSSLWASCTALWQIQLERLRRAFNVEPPDSTKPQQRFPDGYTNLSRMLGDVSSQTPPPKPGGAGSDSPADTPESKSLHVSSKPTSKPTTENRPWIFRPLPPLPEPNNDLTKATGVFRRSLAKNWRQTFPPPPRGTFLVTGLVEVYGPKGICTIDAMATYDPRESRYVGLALAVRRLQRRKQKPRG